MKNALRLFAALAVMAAVALTFTACDDGDDWQGITVTVTDIPSGPGGSANLNFVDVIQTGVGMDGVAVRRETIAAGSVETPTAGGNITFHMWVPGTVNGFNTAGNISEILLTIPGSATRYVLTNRNVTWGANTISFWDFTRQ